jgi:hypothetical protein
MVGHDKRIEKTKTKNRELLASLIATNDEVVFMFWLVECLIMLSLGILHPESNYGFVSSVVSDRKEACG